MDENNIDDFSWSAMFFVTACSSFIFSGCIKLMDGRFSNLLLIIGGVAAFLAVISCVTKHVIRQANKKRKKQRFAPDSY